MGKFDQIKQKNWVTLLLLTDKQLLQKCRVNHFLSSKSGGQHRDKKASSVRLTLFDGEINVVSSASRSLQTNQIDALRKLKLEIICKYRSDNPLKECIENFHLEKYFNNDLLIKNQKINIAKKNDDFLPFAGVVLEIFFVNHWHVQVVAKYLGVSSSHLVKFLSKEKRLLIWVNEQRKQFGIGPLK